MTAVYVNEGDTVEREAVLTMGSPVVLDGGKIAFFAERDLPAEWKVIETGILMSQSAEFEMDTAGVLKAASVSKENKGQYTVRKAGVSAGELWYGRAYVVYEVNGEVRTGYSEAVSAVGQ